MGVDVGKYEVVSDCYIPVGRGFRYKRPGQVVTLTDVQADSVAEHIKPADEGQGRDRADKPKRKRVAKRNTPVVEEVVEPPVVEEVVEPPVVEEVVEPPVVEEVVEPPVVEDATGEVVEEVTSDVGYPIPDDE